MTEEQWYTSTNTNLLFDQVNYQVTDRKCRLLCVALIKQEHRNIIHGLSKAALKAALHFADRMFRDSDQANAAVRTLRNAGNKTVRALNDVDRDSRETEHIHLTNVAHACSLVTYAPGLLSVKGIIAILGMQNQPIGAHLIREVSGNPFHRKIVLPIIGKHIHGMARRAYYTRTNDGSIDNALLGILADALEEAGCTEQSALDHLRDGQLHVRGCWVLDLILFGPDR